MGMGGGGRAVIFAANEPNFQVTIILRHKHLAIQIIQFGLWDANHLLSLLAATVTTLQSKFSDSANRCY